MTEQRFLKRLTWVGFVLTMIAVAMQMIGIDGGFLTSYLADLAGPVWFYGVVRQRKLLFKKLLPSKISPMFAAVFVFSVGTAWEVCQAFDLSGTPLAITRGRFDPWDIVCYAVSLSACYALDSYYKSHPPG